VNRVTTPNPGGGPPYPDVAFDHARAQEVIRQLDALIPVLNQQRQDRSANGQSLRQSWKGRYAVEFDGELRRMATTCADLVTEARALRGRLADAAATATAQQRWREQQNVEWFIQKLLHTSSGTR
jgi:hypothetical protein